MSSSELLLKLARIFESFFSFEFSFILLLQVDSLKDLIAETQKQALILEDVANDWTKRIKAVNINTNLYINLKKNTLIFHSLPNFPMVMRKIGKNRPIKKKKKIFKTLTSPPPSPIAFRKDLSLIPLVL